MRKREKLLTIWTGEQVHLLFIKGVSADQQSIVHESMGLETCKDIDYLEWVYRMLDSSKIGSVELIWVILKESFPYGSFGEQADRWIIRRDLQFGQLCTALPNALLPRYVFSGVDVMKAVVGECERIWKPGNGGYMGIGEKGYFIGYGEQDPFVRISRNPEQYGGDGIQVFREDWLQQTRMLYQNRTGYQLKSIFHVLQERAQTGCSEEGGIVIESISTQLDESGNLLDRPLSAFLSLVGSNSPMNCVQLDILDQRRCRNEMYRGFKTGVGLLLLGGCLLLAAACKSGAFSGPMEATFHQSWDTSIAEWGKATRIWNEKSTRVRNRRLAILLAGRIGSSLPEQVQLTRLQVKKASHSGAAMDMIMEGGIASEASSDDFQSWVDDLVDTGVLDDVRNLQYDSSGKNLNFVLHALSGGGNPN